VHVGGLDLALEKPNADSRSKAGGGGRDRCPARCWSVSRKKFRKGPLFEGELDVERGRSAFPLLQELRREALVFRVRRDAGRIGRRAVADGVGLDLLAISASL